LFSRPTYVSVGDPFVQAGLNAMGRTQVKDGYLRGGHEKDFVPAKAITEKVPKAPYEYVPQGPGPKKNFKDEEGNIRVGPPNITTCPTKQGKTTKGTTFGGPIPYMPDDYYAAKKEAQKDLEYHLSKLQEKPFSQKAKHTEFFNNFRQVYEENPPIPPRQPAPEPPRPQIHDHPFKPTNPPKKGVVTIGKHPEYIPNPPVEKKPVRKAEGEEERKGFKAPTQFRSRPTPSVATNIRNLKASYPTMFRR
jgi:hypothetical protein